MNLHEHIKKVLREEVNKKYLKPSEKSEKFILDRTNSKAMKIYENVTTDEERFKKNIEEQIFECTIIGATEDDLPY